MDKCHENERVDEQNGSLKVEPLSVSETSMDGSSRGKTRKRKLHQRDEHHSKIPRAENKSPTLDDNTNDNESQTSNSDASEYGEIYYVKVSNLPCDWDHEQIQKFMDKECGPFDSINILANGKTFNGSLKLGFESLEEAVNVKKTLDMKDVDGKRLKADVFGNNNDTLTDILEPLKSSQKPDFDVWATDPKGQYGLKEQYLDSLNIKPPVHNAVQIFNFRCEKSELVDVFKLAGNVITCHVTFASPKFAKITYSHPLEAVQAVSMFHGQKLFGNDLRVIICPPDDIVLPRGLPNIGPGLGENGKPLIEVVRHYKNYVKGRTTELNKSIFKEADEIATVSLNRNSNAVDVKESKSKDLELSKQSDITNEDLGSPIDVKVSQLPTINKSKTKNRDPRSSNSMKRHSDHPIWGPLPKNNSGQSPSAWSGQTSNAVEINHPRGPNTGQYVRFQSASVPGSSGPTYGPMPGASGPMYSHHTGPAGPIQMQGAICGPASQFSVQMPGPMGRNQGHSMQTGPISGPQSHAMQTGQMPMQNLHNPMEGMPRQNIPMQMGMPNVPLSGQVPLCSSMARPSQGLNNPSQPFSLNPNAAMNNSYNMSGTQKLTSNVTGSLALEFSNLPLTTTVQFLSDKLSQVGQMVLLKLTTPGNLIVEYSSPEHAENCFRKFHRSYLGGNLIEVNYL